MDRRAAVYVIRNVTNNKVYVGKSVVPQERWNHHRYVARVGPTHRAFKAVHAAMRKYGVENFTFDVIEWFDSEDEAYWFEDWWICFLRSNVGGHGYNLYEGGLGGRTITDETREKIAAKLRGRKRPVSVVEKVAAALRGRKHSEDHRAKVSASLMGREVSTETREKIGNGNRGKKRTPEQIDAQRERGRLRGFPDAARVAAALVSTGRPRSPETREKIAAKQRGKKLSPEHVAKLRGKKRSEESRRRMSEAAKLRANRSLVVPVE